MPTPNETARYWRDCARESRQLAEKMANETAKRAMLAIAHNYDQLAEWALPAKATSGPRACTGL